jgi:hypothetical protein
LNKQRTKEQDFSILRKKNDSKSQTKTLEIKNKKNNLSSSKKELKRLKINRIRIKEDNFFFLQKKEIHLKNQDTKQMIFNYKKRHKQHTKLFNCFER